MSYSKVKSKAQTARRIKRERNRTINAAIAKADSLWLGENGQGWNELADFAGPKRRFRQSSDERIDGAIRVEFSTHNSRHQSINGLAGRTKQYSKERITKVNGVPVK